MRPHSDDSLTGQDFRSLSRDPKQGWCHTLFIGRDALTIPPAHPSFFA